MSQDNNPATLVAIIVAARRADNRPLERTTRRLLQRRFGVQLRFASNPGDNDNKQGVRDANHPA